eukprot:GCRY01003455.1.p1 GENE.GCRY01003455.1~~GCRY01003455.1.p1  ORF type:complete len:727 (-),score=165.02 GCRY01003455.1:479-2659(-)
MSSGEDLFDDDEFDSEEDYEEESKPKRQKRSANAFLDLEAEVDEEEEGDEVDYAEDLEEAALADQLAAEEATRGNKQRNAFRLAARDDLERDEDLAELARGIEERNRRYIAGGDDVYGSVSQQALLPSVSDPKLWLCRCKIGAERELAVSLLNRYIHTINSEHPLLVKSVIARDSLKGFIYIEAEKDAHLKNLSFQVQSLYAQRTLVPIKEMVPVLSGGDNDVPDINVGQFVRCKRGTYKGDIGQVVAVTDTQESVTLKLVPRLDYEAIKQRYRRTIDGAALGQKRKNTRTKPPQRYFNREELRDLHALLEQRRDQDAQVYYLFENNKYRDGFLIKDFLLKNLEVDGVTPSLEELQRFKHKDTDRADLGDDDDDAQLPQVAHLTPKSANQYVRGDSVIVVKGDLKGLTGVVENVDGDSVNVRPMLEGVHLLAFQPTELMKHFKPGDHVKVVDGRYKNETGLVVRVDDDCSATVFSDLTRIEFRTLITDLIISSEVSSGQDSIGDGRYELFDLVVVDNTRTGVIVKIENETCRVLDNHGQVASLDWKALGPKRSSRRIEGFDSKNQTISAGDIVSVLDGKYAGRKGTIKHIHRSFIFLHSNDVLENSGIFVVRASNTLLSGGSKASEAASHAQYGPDAGAFIPQSPMHPSQQQRPSPNRHGMSMRGGRGGGGGGGGGGGCPCHSYQTFVGEQHRHSSTSTFPPSDTYTGTRRGKTMGNQENMPSVSL